MDQWCCLRRSWPWNAWNFQNYIRNRFFNYNTCNIYCSHHRRMYIAPQKIRILIKAFYICYPSLVIPTWTGDELSRGQVRGRRTHGNTDRETQATTTPGGQNWPRVKKRYEIQTPRNRETEQNGRIGRLAYILVWESKFWIMKDSHRFISNRFQTFSLCSLLYPTNWFAGTIGLTVQFHFSIHSR